MSAENLLSRPWNHGNRIPRTNLHAQRAAGADVVLGFDVGGGGLVAHAHEAVVPRGDCDAGFAAGALVVIDEGHSRGELFSNIGLWGFVAHILNRESNTEGLYRQ